jgi:hypothetical protein
MALDVSLCALGDAGLRPLFAALPANKHLRTLESTTTRSRTLFMLPAVRANSSLRELKTGFRPTRRARRRHSCSAARLTRRPARNDHAAAGVRATCAERSRWRVGHQALSSALFCHNALLLAGRRSLAASPVCRTSASSAADSEQEKNTIMPLLLRIRALSAAAHRAAAAR